MSIACVFPGRGSQSVGMLQALAREHPQVRDTFDEASQHLGLPLHGPVRWGGTIGHMVDKGIVDILELGPGKVLTGLNKRIERKIGGLCVQDRQGLKQALTRFGGP